MAMNAPSSGRNPDRRWTSAWSCCFTPCGHPEVLCNHQVGERLRRWRMDELRLLQLAREVEIIATALGRHHPHARAKPSLSSHH
jgi:hypothetical protein